MTKKKNIKVNAFQPGLGTNSASSLLEIDEAESMSLLTAFLDLGRKLVTENLVHSYLETNLLGKKKKTCGSGEFVCW